MSGLVALIGPTAGIAIATIATIGTILSVGVAFLLAPSRATLYWSFAYTLLMVATFGGIAGVVNDMPWLQRASFGAAMAAPALLWSGFRARRGARPLPSISIAVAIISIATLQFYSATESADLARRVVFCLSTSFAALILVEWVRMPRPRPRIMIALVVASVALFLTGIANVIGGFVAPQQMEDDLAVLRLLATFILMVYMVCGLIAVLGLSLRRWRYHRRSATAPGWEDFERTAAERLDGARRSAQSWSVIWVQLDDADDIRRTSGVTALARLARRFEEQLRSVLPAESQIGIPRAGTVVALIPRSDAYARDLLRDVLASIAALDVGDRVLQPSASAGWAQTSTIGYELSALIYMSREAAALASENGGDRWERVGSTVIDRLLGSPEAIAAAGRDALGLRAGQ